MDPNNLQDLVRCDLCETIVDSYCDVCNVSLCRPCIGEHISDGYHKHTIVSFRERKSTLIYPKCRTHQQKNCKFQCKDCNDICVCSSCMASEQHTGHKYVDITEVYNAKKEVIENDTENLENIICPSYKDICVDLETQFANLDEGYGQMTKEMLKQGEELHREIEMVINMIKNEISQINIKHIKILQTHLDEIKAIQSRIQNTLLALKEIEKSTEVSSIIEYRSTISEFSKLPPTIHVKMPKFIPKPIDREKLYSLFGDITPLSTDTEERVLTLNQAKSLIKELLDEATVVATVETMQKKLCRVIYVNEERIWTCGKTNKIRCFNIRGILRKLFFEQFSSINGDLIYSSGRTGTVNKVRNDKTEEFINLPKDWTPSQLCITYSGDLLVTMFNDANQSKVVRYSGSTEKQTIQYDDEGKPLYSGNTEIKYITENRNHDICVADCGAGAVVVIDKAGKLRWRYTGDQSMTREHPFAPYGITTDSQSRILTSDFDNHCIHILDLNGQFLRYIDNCDLKNPIGLCMDSNDNLYVCEYNSGKVKKIKYSN